MRLPALEDSSGEGDTQAKTSACDCNVFCIKGKAGFMACVGRGEAGFREQ